MKKLGLALGLSAALMLGGGCKKQVSDNDAIRAGILQHLNGVGTLNMSAMDMDIRRDRKSTRLNSSHRSLSRMPSSA